MRDHPFVNHSLPGAGFPLHMDSANEACTRGAAVVEEQSKIEFQSIWAAIRDWLEFFEPLGDINVTLKKEFHLPGGQSGAHDNQPDWMVHFDEDMVLPVEAKCVRTLLHSELCDTDWDVVEVLRAGEIATCRLTLNRTCYLYGSYPLASLSRPVC